MQVQEQNGEIIFLRKLQDGPAGESYGLHVAGLAGLPETVLRRAEELLEKLKEGGNMIRGTLPSFVRQEQAQDRENGQAVKSPEEKKMEILIDKLVSIDVNSLTPLEALNTLQKLKDLVTSAFSRPGKKGKLKQSGGQENSSAKNDSRYGALDYTPPLFDVT
jgi:DNA mismatch repair protein MutS